MMTAQAMNKKSNCLNVFDQFVKLALKELTYLKISYAYFCIPFVFIKSRIKDTKNKKFSYFLFLLS